MLPSLVLLILLSWVYIAYGQPARGGCGIFYGIKPAVTALVLHAAHRIGSARAQEPLALGHGGGSLCGHHGVGACPFPAIVLAAALAGHCGRASAGRSCSSQARRPCGSAQRGYGPALIDDDTPAPAHALFTRRRLVQVLTIGVGLWLLAMAVLLALYGLQGTLTQMGWFFTKAALMTFGGAYAVLPYVFQGAVEDFGWLTAQQMIDGLALGETTPGPLIMVVAFVGFMGGWLQPMLGSDALFASGALAASVVTFFTFLPSFVFILVGGPFIETTHGQLKFTAPLTAITAAVVGVILNLALFFAYHVWWPAGFNGPFDAPSAVLTVLAALALFRFKVGVVPLIVVCAVAGVAWRLLVVGG